MQTHSLCFPATTYAGINHRATHIGICSLPTPHTDAHGLATSPANWMALAEASLSRQSRLAYPAGSDQDVIVRVNHFAISCYNTSQGGREDADFGGNNYPLRGMKFTDVRRLPLPSVNCTPSPPILTHVMPPHRLCCRHNRVCYAASLILGDGHASLPPLSGAGVRVPAV